MTVKLKNLDKTINKFKKKIIKILTSGTVPNEIGKQINKDILDTMADGKMPNGKGGIKLAPKLTKKTKAFYRASKVNEEPRFDFKGKLKRQIKTVRIGNKICIGPSTDEAARKVQYLANSKKINGKPKKKRYVMLWTKGRTKIIKNIISSAIKRNFN